MNLKDFLQKQQTLAEAEHDRLKATLTLDSAPDEYGDRLSKLYGWLCYRSLVSETLHQLSLGRTPQELAENVVNIDNSPGVNLYWYSGLEALVRARLAHTLLERNWT